MRLLLKPVTHGDIMKTTLIRITLATAAIAALGLSACSAGAETKPAGNTQAVSIQPSRRHQHPVRR